MPDRTGRVWSRLDGVVGGLAPAVQRHLEATPAVVWVGVPSDDLTPYHDKYDCGYGSKLEPRRLPTLRAAAQAIGISPCRKCTAEGRAATARVRRIGAA